MKRVFAFYLPQFHPIPENDEWWGKGFTEWTNVKKAKPLFKGHDQPVIPGEMGYYSLLDEDIRERQAKMAREHGVEGFIYWHYWFGGKRLLEKPAEQVLVSGKPDFPFCFAWANETWTGVWHGEPGRILIEQTYPGENDLIEHFYHVLPYFKDKRYIQINDKPVFYIYRPTHLPNAKGFINLWNDLAIKEGLKGIYFIANSGIPDQEKELLLEMGFDSIFSNRLSEATYKASKKFDYRLRFNLNKLGLNRRMTRKGVFTYLEVIKNITHDNDADEHLIPMIFPNWDNSPRSGRNALILTDGSPETFKKHLEKVKEVLTAKSADKQIAIIKSWNEWAEGNYMEPDDRNGTTYLELLKEFVS